MLDKLNGAKNIRRRVISILSFQVRNASRNLKHHEQQALTGNYGVNGHRVVSTAHRRLELKSGLVSSWAYSLSGRVRGQGYPYPWFAEQEWSRVRELFLTTNRETELHYS